MCIWWGMGGYGEWVIYGLYLLNIHFLLVNNTNFPLGNLLSSTQSTQYECLWGVEGTIAVSLDFFQTYINDPNLTVHIPTHGYSGYNHGYRWAQNPSESQCDSFLCLCSCLGDQLIRRLEEEVNLGL